MAVLPRTSRCQKLETVKHSQVGVTQRSVSCVSRSTLFLVIQSGRLHGRLYLFQFLQTQQTHAVSQKTVSWLYIYHICPNLFLSHIIPWALSCPVHVAVALSPELRTLHVREVHQTWSLGSQNRDARRLSVCWGPAPAASCFLSPGPVAGRSGQLSALSVFWRHLIPLMS